MSTYNATREKRVISEDTSTVPRIHNRTGHRFGGFLHEPQPIVSAETLWKRLQSKVSEARSLADIKKLSESGASTGISSSLQNTFYIATRERYISAENIHRFDPVVMMMDNYKGLDLHEFYPQFSEKHFFNHLPKYGIKPTVRLAGKLEDEEAFQARSQYRLLQKPKDTDPEWDALQQTLEPTLAEEDVLGDFETWVSRTPQDVRFLLIGDTNHKDNVLQSWINGGSYLRSLKDQGFEDILMEWPITFQPALKHYFDNGDAKALQAKAKTIFRPESAPDIVNLCKEAKHHGVRFHAYDEQLRIKKFRESPRFGYERIKHDTTLAAHIEAEIGDKKTAIIYGALHFMVQTSLIEVLGQDNCRAINIHPDLKDFRGSEFQSVYNARFVTPYAFIIKENTAVSSFGHYMRGSSANRHLFLQSVQMGLQEEEKIKFEERYKAYYKGPHAPNSFGIDPEEIMEGVYWHEKALECRFYHDRKRFSPDQNHAPAMHENDNI